MHTTPPYVEQHEYIPVHAGSLLPVEAVVLGWRGSPVYLTRKSEVGRHLGCVPSADVGRVGTRAADRRSSEATGGGLSGPIDRRDRGIFSGMKSGYPSREDVLADLGDKVAEGIVLAVAQTRSDLRVYRRVFPGWVADATDRGLLSWCHDRAWSHLAAAFDEVHEVSFVDQPPLREMYVGTRYRMRFKKHGLDDELATYPTQTALAFLEQGACTLDGLDEVHLVAGYRWDPVLREVGAGVISLRDGKQNVIWTHVLAEPAGNVVPVTPILPVAGPQAPLIDMPAERKDAGKAEGAEDS